MWAVYFNESGGPGVLKEGEVHDPIPEDDEVLIKVAAVGIDTDDLLRLSFITYKLTTDTSPYLGFECSGEVIAIGSKVFTCKIGDKVCAYLQGGGGYAEVVAVRAALVMVVPFGIPLTHAASLPQTACLTLWCLKHLRKITSDQSILIHGGAGGVGSFVIQYAKYMGCDVFATEGNKEKLQLCQELGAKVCINYKTEDFCKRVKAETKGKGVNIILDLVGRDYIEKNFDCLAIGGALIVIGYETGSNTIFDLQKLYQKKISVLGAWTQRLSNEKIEQLLIEAQNDVWPLISRGHITPIIGKAFKFSEAVNAHRAKEKYVFPGKILLVPG
ncbi:hypothetical protein BUALT_Bualt08G0009000 [Buddleja alternifolia]|uniref:Enoyl reductase (ER) domain-containing protein n=1 Tax=Buddleja alternifolia TaxID=168488 RepID=A0AAV6X424_9LAMI|nr:hypothetical protein BUALT_Bualt08G0009000 [Buddleja alternifolia]